MSLFDVFRSPSSSSSARPRSAEIAKERLQILVAHERADRGGPDYLPMLQKEILQVIEKYIQIDSNKVEVKLERGTDISTLEVNIELPGARALSEKVVRPVAVGVGSP